MSKSTAMHMKIILSRKGFDSRYGGVPSLILEDGTMMSAPIPEMNEKCVLFDTGKRYADLRKMILPEFDDKRYEFCHLDPDIRPELHASLPPHWKPILGQSGVAARHLEKHHVAHGDLFLFWGWFRKVGEPRPFHAIWGYMQVGKVVRDTTEIERYSWHPHSREYYCGKESPWKQTNTLYIGTDKIIGMTGAENIPGYGTFLFNEGTRSLLKLTRDGDSSLTHWRADALPWLDWKKRKSHMTYHDDEKRFARDGSYFQAASRGQEFVVDGMNEKTMDWLKQLLKYRRHATR